MATGTGKTLVMAMVLAWQFLNKASDKVKSRVKNDHLGLEIHYQYEGVVRKYRPDFLVRLVSGTNLLLETKGKPGGEADAKELAAAEWVEAVNAAGRFGSWRHERCDKPQRVLDVVESA